MAIEKRCVKCRETKAQEEFSKNRAMADGLSNHCKKCHNTYRRDLRKRKMMDGRKIKTAKVEAILVTRGICPHCGNETLHVVK